MDIKKIEKSALDTLKKAEYPENDSAIDVIDVENVLDF